MQLYKESSEESLRIEIVTICKWPTAPIGGEGGEGRENFSSGLDDLAAEKASSSFSSCSTDGCDCKA